MNTEILRLVLATLSVAAQAGINYRRLAEEFERIRAEGREPTIVELQESAQRRDDAIDSI